MATAMSKYLKSVRKNYLEALESAKTQKKYWKLLCLIEKSWTYADGDNRFTYALQYYDDSLGLGLNLTRGKDMGTVLLFEEEVETLAAANGLTVERVGNWKEGSSVKLHIKEGVKVVISIIIDRSNACRLVETGEVEKVMRYVCNG